MSFYARIFLEAVGLSKAWIVLYVPLNDDGRYSKALSTPHLVKALQDSRPYFGELIVGADGMAYLHWGAETGYTSPIDLFAAPVCVARAVEVQSFYYQGDKVPFVIRDISRL